MPVDEEALDAFLASDGEPTPEPTENASEASTGASEEVVENELPAGQDKFDRAYVEKLRKESASYRERAKKYNEVFEGYDTEAVEEWLDLAKTFKDDPRSVAQRFKEIYEAVEAQYGEEAAEEVAEHLTEPAKSTGEGALTKSEILDLLDEREREVDIKRRVAQIEADAQALGYEVGSESYDELLWHAQRTKTGDIKEAHEKLQAKYQAYFDKQVGEMGNRPNPMVTEGGAPASGERKMKTFEEANEALEAFLQGL